MDCNDVLVFVYLYLQTLYCVHGKAKNSLVFVIDDTYSMNDEIDQVKQKTYEVFDAVLSSNGSTIDDFVLVTFNDPETKLLIRTRDKHEYKEAVKNIQVHGGDDCEEYAMSGIELALENSKPNSIIYVYTDASAKDYNIFERVKSLSQKKSTQVTFLLTGNCGSTSGADSLVFKKLAEATSGQVFNIQKDSVHKIIDYIIKSIKHEKTTLCDKSFKSDAEKTMNFTVDSKVWDVMISIAGDNSKLRVIDADNVEIETEEIVRTGDSYVVTLNTKPGVYRVVVNSNGETSVVVTGSTVLSFQHGFSTFEPTTINETSTKPIPEQPSFLSIELDNVDRDVFLKTVELRDEHDNIIKQLPLKLVNEKQQFYSTDVFIPPNVSFKIAIRGFTKSSEMITRLAPTTIEYQKINLEVPKNLSPTVTILADDKLETEPNKSLTIKCKVSGYPKPDILWLDSSGASRSATVNAVDFPYVYMSVLNIDKVEENVKFTCKAINAIGEDSKTIDIEIKNFFHVLQYPTDTTIQYGKTADIGLKLDVSQPTTILWYKDNKILTSNENFYISTDRSTLTIKDMHPKLQGRYAVEAFNDIDAKRFDFNVLVSGAEAPMIDKSINTYHIRKGSSVDIPCRIIKGKPKPKLNWSIDREYSGTFQEITTNSTEEENYHIDNVNLEDGGAYKCVATNDIGEDVHDIDVFVEYPPVISSDVQHKVVNEGELVQLFCSVDGVPTPSVRWLIDGDVITSKSKYKIYRDNTLRVSVHDNGIYQCEASNPLGRTHTDVHLNIFVPPTIESPKQSFIELKLGSPLILPCRADGYPKPHVKWTFFSKDPKLAPRTLRTDMTNSLVIKRVQLYDEGFYTCVASYDKNESNITYEVHVTVPPSIINSVLDKTMNVVEGDLVLRIPCKAVGSPKPTVTWMFGNEIKGNIVSGTEWYDVAEDGTLIIKNIDKRSAGSYICKAENSMGSAFEDYKVNVLDYPQPASKISTVLVKEGSFFPIECRLSHKRSDIIRWFKNGRVIKNGELFLNEAKISDSGVYSCRVSNFKNSHSAHYNITVGFKPAFVADEETKIHFDEGAVTVLSCNAIGEPIPKVHWWKNGEKIEDTSTEYVLFMDLDNIGQYTCKVGNEFGTISRTFNIDVEECKLNIESSFNDYQPLLLSEDLTRSPDGLLQIPFSHRILLYCPNSFVTIEDDILEDRIEGSCVGKSIFNVNERRVDFSDIRCTKKVESLTKATGTRCSRGNSELLNIGFDIGNEFLGVYDVCLDRDNNVPIYTRHDIHPLIANRVPKEIRSYVENDNLPYQFDDMYNCWLQRQYILKLTGKRLSTNRNCCFAKRQLVNPRDFTFGHNQVATYNYLNVIPKWGTCGTENWDKVEERVRSLVQTLDHPLEVWTGASHLMKLPAQPNHNTVHLSDRFNNKQRVPRYIWKVINNHYEREALAIVQINIPDITQYQAFSFMLCKDICHEIEWMRGSEWRNVKKGFTFCCNIKEFESAFGYKNIFKFRDLDSKVLI